MGRWMDNGERVYYDITPLLKRVRTWFVWIGGWERPHWDGDRFSHQWRLRQSWDGKLASPTPVSLLNHSLTLFGWGWQLTFWRWPYLRLTWSHYRKGWPVHVYISRDGTPPRPGKRGLRIWPRADYYWN